MIGVIILAAGPSTRMGEPKQNLRYKAKSLLQHSLDAAIQSGCTPVIVVLGANAGNSLNELANEKVSIVLNTEWQEGMSSSIRKGVEELKKIEPNVSDVILMVCDQPFVNPGLLKQLIEKKTSSGKKIVASFYNNTSGVPVLFDKTFFPELLLLQGPEGAKRILNFYIELVAEVKFPEGDIDVDTQQDYEALKKR